MRGQPFPTRTVPQTTAEFDSRNSDRREPLGHPRVPVGRSGTPERSVSRIGTMSPRDAFLGHHEYHGPVGIEGDPEDVLRVLLGDEAGHEGTHSIEPALDE